MLPVTFLQNNRTRKTDSRKRDRVNVKHLDSAEKWDSCVKGISMKSINAVLWQCSWRSVRVYVCMCVASCYAQVCRWILNQMVRRMGSYARSLTQTGPWAAETNGKRDDIEKREKENEKKKKKQKQSSAEVNQRYKSSRVTRPLFSHTHTHTHSS